jgi:YcxB-like protein
MPKWGRVQAGRVLVRRRCGPQRLVGVELQTHDSRKRPTRKHSAKAAPPRGDYSSTGDRDFPDDDKRTYQDLDLYLLVWAHRTAFDVDACSQLSYSPIMLESADLTVQISLRPQDVYDPVRDLFLYSRGNIIRWAFALFACCLIYETRPIWSSTESQPEMLVLFLFFLLVFLALFLFPYLRVRSIFHETPALRKPRSISFSTGGLHLESEDARGDYKWSVFPNVVETPRVFLFMQTTRSGALYVPKRCLSGPDDVVKLRNLIRANFAGKARLRHD